MRAFQSRPPLVRADLRGERFRVALLASRFHEDICETLLSAARAGLERHGVPAGAIEVHRVPGAFELPLAARWLAETGRYDAVIALGCVVKGETDHDVYINHAVADGLQRVALRCGIPVVLGVLTTLDREQAVARANPQAGGGKGWDCALTALEMMALRVAIAQAGGSAASPGAGDAGSSRDDASSRGDASPGGRGRQHSSDPTA